jgi:hypothetical protein
MKFGFNIKSLALCLFNIFILLKLCYDDKKTNDYIEKIKLKKKLEKLIDEDLENIINEHVKDMSNILKIIKII